MWLEVQSLLKSLQWLMHLIYQLYLQKIFRQRYNYLMKIILFALLIVALTAIHLTEESVSADAFKEPPLKCYFQLKDKLGNNDGKLTYGGKNFVKTCSKVEVTSILSTCIIRAECLNREQKKKNTSLELKQVDADFCCS